MRSWDVVSDYLEKKKIRILFCISLIVILFLVLVYFPFLQRKEFYKEFLLNQISQATGLNIEVADSDLIILPFPGIELNHVSIKKNNVLLAVSNRIDLDISWFGLLRGVIELRDISVEGGSLFLERRKDGSFDLLEYLKEGDRNLDQRSSVKLIPENLTTNLGLSAKNFVGIGLKNIEINNFTLEYKEDSHNREYRVYFYRSRSSVSFYGTELQFLFKGKIDEQPIDLQITAALEKSTTDWDKLQFKVVLNLEELSLSLLRDLFFIFPSADLSKTTITGRIEASKDENSSIRFKVRSLVKDLAYKGGAPFGKIKADVDFDLDPFGRKISLSFVDALWEGVAKVTGTGSVNWKNRTVGQFDIHSDYADYHNLIKLCKLFQVRDDLFDPKSPPGIFYFNAELNNLFAFKHRFLSVKGEAKYVYPMIAVPSFHAFIYNGEIVGKAKIFPFVPKIEVEGEAFRLQSDRILLPYLSERIISGELYSRFFLETSIRDRSRDTVTELFANMVGSGNLEIRNGELIGYANFMIPVLNTLGKIISFKGVDGRKFQFSDLKSDLRVRNNRLFFPNLSIEGSGMEVDGNGNLGFDKRIDMILYLRLGGKLVGQAAKIPILYKGIFGKGIPYIDPIWLGSVYAGSILLGPYLLPLGGPYGGGVAGSVIGEYVRDLWDGVNGLFGGSDDDTSKKPKGK
ncbi:AsmA domain protein [Leptospira broomii serovar Hurstbridge str. 5399]|uniref:AsmA domain protein n=1 Tax=Leptospira broomii serovar Hurstbridge str. 5399 TaxID=1049789 RepID=T0GGJ1_9LEPT|nr:AsmA family protein [Leptospira broomii]EQA45979.1 AsmA domain protein [Leptospira broomii serovar Hurstbridge str. 5399]